jgi:hypothetical protein
MNGMSSARRGLVFGMVLGTVASVIVPVLLNFTTTVPAQISFCIGLVGTVLTALIGACVLFTDRFESLEKAVTDSADWKTMPEPADLVIATTGHLVDLRAASGRHSEFFWTAALSAMRQAERAACDAANGLVTCTQDEEIYLVAEALRLTETSVSAIAARGASWWTRPEADVYWRAYEKAAAELDIRRVFLLESGLTEEVRGTLDRHAAMGMKTYWISRDRVPRPLQAPIVLFDDSLLHRPAGSRTDGHEQVSFTRDPWQLRQARINFESILNLRGIERWPRT